MLDNKIISGACLIYVKFENKTYQVQCIVWQSLLIEAKAHLTEVKYGRDAINSICIKYMFLLYVYFVYRE